MEITGTHKGKPVTIKFEIAIARELLERNKRIMDKFLSKNIQKLAMRYAPIIASWEAILEQPKLINAPEHAQLKKEYINKVLFSEDGWDRQFS